MQGTKPWPKVSKYRRRSQTLYSINCGQDGHVYKTNIRTFIHSFYTLQWWCVFLKHKIQRWPFFLCTDWMAICSEYTDSTLGINKSNATVAWSWHWMILHGAIRLWWQAKTAREIFMTMYLIWHSINKSECKAELNFDNFSGRNCCFDAMCLISFHYFMLGWKWRFFCVNDTTWNALTTGSFK